ncbi:hypothetical protein KR009_010016, partial [Drosophila setifemur]
VMNSSGAIYLLRELPIMATFVIASGIILASKGIWAGEKSLKWSKKKPYYDILMFNELSSSCAWKHSENPVMSESKEVQCENEHCYRRKMAKIVQQIDHAVYSIDLAICIFTSKDLGASFKRARDRGVSIRIYTDREMNQSVLSQIDTLSAYGVEVRGPDTTNIMHHKYCVIDGVERVEELRLLWNRKYMRPTCTILLNGSLNWTYQAICGNWENLFITDNEEMSRLFQTEFSRMWK